MSSSHDTTRDATVHGDIMLSDFFKRPVLIDTQIWTPGTPFTPKVINPWDLYFVNPRVANRVSNYALFSGKLHVKIMINGNSFYYGRLMVHYDPLPGNDDYRPVLGDLYARVQASQRLKIFIDPCESQGGEMMLPFMWPFDMASLPFGDYALMGQMQYNVINELKHANGATTELTINTYAWMEDIKLSGPTGNNIAALVPQSGDEYGAGVASATASALAGVAGNYSKIPIIGKYARATSIAMNAVSGIAKLFGFSRPTAVDTPMLMRHRPVGELAVTDTSDTCQKLTVDSKQELSIDPAIVGVASGDEMVISDVAARESYVFTFNWLTTDPKNTPIFSSRVTPAIYRFFNATYYLPACAYAAAPFKYWRGKMRYRFQIVASSYHKGRLLFVWDPYANTTVPETNVQYTKIVDIGSERDFVFDIPWGNRSTWCEVAGFVDQNVSSVLSYTSQSQRLSNGSIAVYVLNELTTPNSTVNNDIQVNVFVSLQDAEFAAPSDYIQAYSLPTQLEAQSDIETSMLPTANAPIMESATEDCNDCSIEFGPQSVVYMGETIMSFRQLMKRYALEWVYSPLSVTTGIATIGNTDFPLRRGRTLRGMLTDATSNYNNSNTTMLNYLSFAFLAFRGGIRRKYVFAQGSSGLSASNISLSRNTVETFQQPALTAFNITDQAAFSSGLLALLPTGLEGSAVTTVTQQPTIEAELPFYRQVRFASTRAPYDVTPATGVAVERLTHRVAWVYPPSANAHLQAYVAGAEDASFFCFQGCAPLTRNAF